MIHQKVYVKELDWLIDIFYDVDAKDTSVILNALDSLHCPERHIEQAEDLLLNSYENFGLTYSCDHCRATVMVIGQASSVGEFFSTLSHEQQHLEQAICKHYGISPYGEDIAYASGAISKEIYENAWRTMKDLFAYVGEEIISHYRRVR